MEATSDPIITINGKSYAVVETDLSAGKTSCEQCAFQGTSWQHGLYCRNDMVIQCFMFDTEFTKYHFEEVTNV